MKLAWLQNKWEIVNTHEYIVSNLTSNANQFLCVFALVNIILNVLELANVWY